MGTEALSHPSYLAQIARAFERGDTPTPELMAHVADCAHCARAYQRWSNAERALSGQPPEAPLTRAETDRVLARLLTTTGAIPAPAPHTRSVWARGVALASATAALALALVISRSTPPEPEFAARGAPAVERTTFRVLRVRGAGESIDVADLRAGTGLRPGDRLRILCSTPRAAQVTRVSVLVANAPQLELHAHEAVVAGAVEQPLGDFVTVSNAWGAGPATLRIEYAVEGHPATLDLGVHIAETAVP